jgi:two-component system cell cycle response regulator DivK
LLATSDYALIEAMTGEEGLALADRERPDLILMDIQLPGIDGYEVTRRIKAIPALSNIPIIAVTSYALGGDDKRAFAAGCDDYVAKPFSPRELRHEHFQFVAVARKLERFGAADLLIDFGHRLDSRRPLHRAIQRDPLDHRPRQRCRDRRCGLGAHDRAERIAQVTHGLVRCHPSPLTRTIRRKVPQAFNKRGTLRGVSEIVFHASTLARPVQKHG